MKIKDYSLEDIGEENIAYIKLQFIFCIENLYSNKNSNIFDQIERVDNPIKNFLNNKELWQYLLDNSPEVFDNEFRCKVKNINCNLFDYDIFEFIFENVLIENILSFTVKDRISLYENLKDQYKNDFKLCTDKNYNNYINEFTNFLKVFNYNKDFSSSDKNFFLNYFINSSRFNNNNNDNFKKLISLSFEKINEDAVYFLENVNLMKDEENRNYCFKKLLSKEHEIDYFYYFLLNINQEIADIIFDKIDINRFETQIEEFLESNLDYDYDEEIDYKIKQIWSFFENNQKSKLLNILKEDIKNSKQYKRKI